MRKIFAIVAIAAGMVMANNAVAGSYQHPSKPAASCGVKKAPTRAAYMKNLRHSPYMSGHNRCVRVDGRVTQRERNCLAASHYRAQRPVRHYERNSQHNNRGRGFVNISYVK